MLNVVIMSLLKDSRLIILPGLIEQYLQTAIKTSYKELVLKSNWTMRFSHFLQ